MPRVQDLRVALGMDWGSASPGCVVWGAALPNGHVHLFDEFKFQRMTAKDVAEAIKAKCREWQMRLPATIYADPSLKPDATGQIGESIGQTLGRHGVPLIYVSNQRVAGWQRLHEALAVDPATGTPWLTLHPRCKYGIRTVPLMVQAKADPEDLDSDSDDHFCDAVRYLLQGGLRPATGRSQTPAYAPNSMGWWRKYYSGRAAEGVLA